LEKFRQIISRQGGDPAVLDDVSRFPRARKTYIGKAMRNGFVTAIHAESIGRACMALGAGRARVDDAVDPAVGALISVKVGQQVQVGDPLADLHFQTDAQFDAAFDLFESAITIGDAPPAQLPLVLEAVS
jgi:pyrimidine-nucleoside phosphorylase